MSKRARTNHSHDDRALSIITYSLVSFFFVIVLYPLLYVVSSSFSSADAVLAGEVFLWPVRPSLIGYEFVFKYKDVFIGFKNSVIYTLVGTSINIVMTIIAAYALARKTLPHRKALMLLFTFTMFFNGGMIPNYMLIKDLNMLDTIWAVTIPGAISVYNMIIAKTFIETAIPNDMLEASQIDGCSDFRYLVQIVIPLSKAIIAVLFVYYMVGHWNGYFNAFLYISSREKYPLQLVLREILINNAFDPQRSTDPELLNKLQGMTDIMKYSLIVISSVPMLILYPMAQRYFIQGVMIGSVKG